MSFDRFDMEEQLMRCWNILEQIDTITEGVLEHDWNSDNVANATAGIKQIYQLEFEKLWDMFEAGIREKKITGSCFDKIEPRNF